MSEFKIHQAALREKIVENLRDFSASVLQIAINSCDMVVDNFLEVNKIAADHKMTFMERAALRKQCRILTNFVRLADFLIIDATLELAMTSIKKILCQLRHAMSENSVPLFAVQIEYNDQDNIVEVSPSPEEFSSCLEEVIKEALLVIETPERLLSHDSLSTYTKACAEDDGKISWSTEELNLVALLNTDPGFNDLTTEIFMLLDEAFDHVATHLETFEPYKILYFKNEQDCKNFGELYDGASGDEFLESIEVYEGQINYFEQVPNSTTISMIKVDSRHFRSILLPSPKKCILAVKERIPTMLQQQGKLLILELNDLNPLAISSPTTPHDFVEKKLHMEKVVAVLPTLKERYSKVRGLYELMESREWRVSDTLKENLILIKEGVEALDKSIGEFEDSVDEETVQFSRALDGEVPIIIDELGQLQKKLSHPTIFSSNSSVASVIEYLEEVNEAVEELKVRGKTLQEYQSVLQQPVSELEELSFVADDMQLKFNLWKAINDWETCSTTYRSMLLSDIDVDTFNKQITNFNKIAFQAEKALDKNDAAAVLRASVTDFKQAMPIVVDLRCDALKERHWADINEITGFDTQVWLFWNSRITL